jgi:hypothetical protein
MRRSIRAPVTDDAARLIVRDLEKLRAQGHQPREVLEQSVKQAWRGVFPIKGEPAAANDWERSADGIKRKGTELGMEPRPNESTSSFRDRIKQRLEVRAR